MTDAARRGLPSSNLLRCMPDPSLRQVTPGVAHTSRSGTSEALLCVLLVGPI